MRNLSIPILYYHRVNRVDARMAVSPDRFREQIKSIASRGWRTIGTPELIEFVETGKAPHKKPFLITFDDGYFDNWYHACPTLEKYGMKALVFMVSDWIGQGLARPRFQDGGEPPMRDLDQAIKAALTGDRDDFLNEAEIREMAASGIFEFGSHGSSHRPCFASSQIDRLLFSRSPHWTKMALAKGDIRPGLPIYEWTSAITVPEFIPSSRMKEEIIRHVEHQGGWEAGKNKKKREEIERLMIHWSKKSFGLSGGGRYESEEEALQRISSDLEASRLRLEELTRAPCLALAWPWGQHSRLGIRAAKKAGLKIAFTTRSGATCKGDHPFRLDRLRVSNKTSGTTLELMMSALSHPSASRLARLFSDSNSTDGFMENPEIIPAKRREKPALAPLKRERAN